MVVPHPQPQEWDCTWFADDGLQTIQRKHVRVHLFHSCTDANVNSSGLTGVTAVLNDGGLYGINASTVNPDGNNATLKFENFGAEPSIMIFDDPSPTRNYSLPGYELLG